MNKKNNHRVTLLGIPAQLGITIFIFTQTGKYFDSKFDNLHKTNVKLFAIIGVFIGLYLVIKQVNRINQKESREK